jgi:hypothetical protein
MTKNENGGKGFRSPVLQRNEPDLTFRFGCFTNPYSLSCGYYSLMGVLPPNHSEIQSGVLRWKLFSWNEFVEKNQSNDQVQQIKNFVRHGDIIDFDCYRAVGVWVAYYARYKIVSPTGKIDYIDDYLLIKSLMEYGHQIPFHFSDCSKTFYANSSLQHLLIDLSTCVPAFPMFPSISLNVSNRRKNPKEPGTGELDYGTQIHDLEEFPQYYFYCFDHDSPKVSFMKNEFRYAKKMSKKRRAGNTGDEEEEEKPLLFENLPQKCWHDSDVRLQRRLDKLVKKNTWIIHRFFKSLLPNDVINLIVSEILKPFRAPWKID